ncbi:MAG: cupin domain-containing protein [Oligoflexales bacterium]
MSDFFSTIKSKIKSIDEDIMKIFPLTRASGFKLSFLTCSKKLPEHHIILKAFAPNGTFFQLQFVGSEYAFTELLEYRGKISNYSESSIDFDRYETNYAEFKKNSHIDNHEHPVDLLILLIKGSISMGLECGNSTFYKAGDFFFIPKELNHFFSIAEKGAQCIEIWKGKDFW